MSYFTPNMFEDKDLDAMAQAAKRMQELRSDGVALDTDDWDEFDDDEKIPGQLEESLDASLESLAAEELNESEGE